MIVPLFQSRTIAPRLRFSCTYFSVRASFSTTTTSLKDKADDVAHPSPSDANLLKYGMPLLARAEYHAKMKRILAYDLYHVKSQNDDTKIEYSYQTILKMSTHIHNHLIQMRSNPPSFNEEPPRIAYLCNPGPKYIATTFASWSTGSIAVPLCISHRASELCYVLQDCDPAFVIDGTNDLTGGRELRRAARDAGLMDRYLCLDDLMADFDCVQEHEEFDGYALGAEGDISSIDSPALIIYTSGTTGNPKGVVHTHKNIYHQITDLVTSWKWTQNDAILHFLPLHHVHGVINKLCCAIWSGASVEFMRFNPISVWKRLASIDDNVGLTKRREITLFMGVPTIFAKMLEVLPQLPETLRPHESMSKIRLVVSGSAALPVSIFNRWRDLTGHTILERYGMTEFAMALSNPLHPESKRLPGYVGQPLPSVEVKIIDEDTGEIIPKTTTNESTRSGELCVRGPTVFSEYWRKPHATAECFDFDGYFRTGDVAEYDPIHESYEILGRVSADIIKCGGHKLSSLQIERALLEHPDIQELTVLGVPDETYGERVGLICRLKPNVEELMLKDLQQWAKKYMARYKIPTLMIVMKDEIPKNAMGKVSKKQLVHLFDGDGVQR